MSSKYSTISAINRAWNTSFANPSAIQYPNVIGTEPLSVSNHYWGDFMNWYHEAITNNTFQLITSAASPYYNILNLNFGDLQSQSRKEWTFQHYTRDVLESSMGSAPAGNSVPIFNTRRHATAFKMYRPPELSMEVQDGSQPTGQ